MSLPASPDMITLAGASVLTGMAAGWVGGYLHRELIEIGRAYGRLARQTWRLLRTGRLTSGERGTGFSQSPGRS